MIYIRGKGARRVAWYDDRYETRGNTVGKSLLALELLQIVLADYFLRCIHGILPRR